MGKNTRFVGLDVHAETIAVAVAEGRDQARSLGTIANRPEAVRRLLGKLGRLSELRVCYEAGPTGYALYWQLTRLGVQCEVIAPSLVPVKSGDRIKTDRRDAERRIRPANRVRDACRRLAYRSSGWQGDRVRSGRSESHNGRRVG
jgi:transposase